MNAGGTAAIFVLTILAERGDFDVCTILVHQNYAEMRAYATGFREKPEQAIGRRICGHIVIFGIAMEKEVAHAAADEPGLMALRP